MRVGDIEQFRKISNRNPQASGGHRGEAGKFKLGTPIEQGAHKTCWDIPSGNTNRAGGGWVPEDLELVSEIFYIAIFSLFPLFRLGLKTTPACLEVVSGRLELVLENLELVPENLALVPESLELVSENLKSVSEKLKVVAERLREKKSFLFLRFIELETKYSILF